MADRTKNNIPTAAATTTTTATAGPGPFWSGQGNLCAEKAKQKRTWGLLPGIPPNPNPPKCPRPMDLPWKPPSNPLANSRTHPGILYHSRTNSNGGYPLITIINIKLLCIYSGTTLVLNTSRHLLIFFTISIIYLICYFNRTQLRIPFNNLFLY